MDKPNRIDLDLNPYLLWPLRFMAPFLLFLVSGRGRSSNSSNTQGGRANSRRGRGMGAHAMQTETTRAPAQGRPWRLPASWWQAAAASVTERGRRSESSPASRAACAGGTAGSCLRAVSSKGRRWTPSHVWGLLTGRLAREVVMCS